ncbi:hypothetical protein, partial [Sphingomonas sp.]|uniref:hypothetical protein n=1 Tax=Sphingomonas sp. TaxID=28214 RepID=UPI00258D0D62
RQAHNLKVTGSNPVPATNFICIASTASAAEAFCVLRRMHGNGVSDNTGPRRPIASSVASVGGTIEG